MKHPFVFFSGTSHPKLAQEVADQMQINLGKILIETFPDGEIGVHVLENVRGRDVYVLQSIARSPNHYLMELLIIVDALRRASALSVNVVIPYFGYARQDRKNKGRVPITAKLVANLLEKAGVARVLTMDLHTDQIQGFFDIPVDNLCARPLLAEAVKRSGIKNLVVATSDVGSIRLARGYADSLKADLVIVAKRRIDGKKVEHIALIGDVKNRDVLLVDDMCTTGGTLKMAAEVCKKAGANNVYAAVTHGILVGNPIQESAIEKLFVSNTVPLPVDFPSERIEIVPVGSLFAKALNSIINATSISSLFH